MKLLKYTLILSVLILGSCAKERVGTVPPTELIKSIKASHVSDNALRINIDIEFKTNVSYEIEYWKQGDESTTRKTDKSDPVLSARSILVILEPNSTYEFRVSASGADKMTTSETYTFRTGMLPADIRTYTLPLDNLNEELQGYILSARRDLPGYIVLTDMKGNVVWYEIVPDGVWVVNYDRKTKRFAAIAGENKTKAYTGTRILVVDLFGNKIVDQDATGLYPHHDIRFLPDGNLILVNYVPKEYDLTAYGGSASEKVWGDGYTIMDMNGAIREQWDCFNELNPQDDPQIMKTKEDWLHANSVNYDLQDNYYMTFNTISELWKINKTTGNVNYRVGHNGNVNLDPAWFANGLHSPYLLDINKILVLDNGRTTGVSRALVYSVDENQKTADVPFEVEFPGEYGTPFMGNATFIHDNLLMFGSSLTMSIVITDLTGKAVRVIGCNYNPYRADYITEINY